MMQKYGGGVGMSVLPALAGVGYICGSKISSYMFRADYFWLILMPVIRVVRQRPYGAFRTGHRMWISEMSSQALWGSYIRYIGAGAVAAAGMISLIKSLPMIASTLWMQCGI